MAAVSCREGSGDVGQTSERRDHADKCSLRAERSRAGNGNPESTKKRDERERLIKGHGLRPPIGLRLQQQDETDCSKRKRDRRWRKTLEQRVLQQEQAADHRPKGKDLRDDVVAGKKPDIDGVEKSADRHKGVVAGGKQSRNSERSRIAPVVADPIVHVREIDGVTREHDPVNQKEADQQYQNDTQNRAERHPADL